MWPSPSLMSGGRQIKSQHWDCEEGPGDPQEQDGTQPPGRGTGAVVVGGVPVVGSLWRWKDT